jgi:UDP-sugar pyrophosphorylase
MNSLTVPRKPGEAVGAICNLVHSQDPAKSLTINVEYNQLGPLLKAINGKGDVADDSGFSPFPGNINVLAFNITKYVEALKASGGVVPEFVNPKYADESRTQFLKPTRLECMMQDFPKLLAGSDAKIGFTQVERWTSFAAVKNKNADAAKKMSKTGIAESAATGEESAYFWYRRVLNRAGVKVAETGSEHCEFFPGIPTNLGAKIVIDANAGLTQADIQSIFPEPGNVTITDRSALVVEGSGVCIKKLDLDGTLIIRTIDNAKVCIDGITVKNDGWEHIQLTNEQIKDESISEALKVRNYMTAHHSQRVIEVFSEDLTITE